MIESGKTDVNDFLRTARSLNLNAANFWEWSNCRTNLPSVWNAIRDYNWGAPTPPPPPPPADIAIQLINTLNTHNPAQAAGLYTPAGVHVTAARTIQGTAAIQTWYQTLLTQLLPNATFNLVSYSGSGSSRHLTWTATSSAGQVNNGACGDVPVTGKCDGNSLKMCMMAAENAIAALQGRRPPNLLNTELWP